MPLPTTHDDLKALAFEVAFRYYTPDELCTRFGLTAEQYNQLTNLPEFQQLVSKAQREIDESGAYTKVAARKLVGALVPTIANIAGDAQQDPADRLAAFKQLVSVSGLGVDDKAGSGKGFAVTINIGDNTATIAPQRTIEADDG